MLRTKRPTEQSPATRCLTFQRLEERLTLSSSTDLAVLTTTVDIDSAASGGFVNVDAFSIEDVATPSLTYSDAESLLSLDEQDSVISNGATNNELTLRDNQGNAVFDLDSIDAWINGLDVQVIPPPELLPPAPDGGLVAIATESQPLNPKIAESKSLETDATVKKSAFVLATTDPGSPHKVALSRGRDISFRVATISPPQAIVGPSHVTFEASNASHRVIQTGTTSREDSEAVSRRENISKDAPLPTPEKPSIEANNTQQPELKQARAKSRSMPPASHSILQVPNRDDLSLNQTELPEEDARSQVFSDWRNRELVALPVLLALTAVPRLVRSLRNPTADTQQLPPKRNGQTIAL